MPLKNLLTKNDTELYEYFLDLTPFQESRRDFIKITGVSALSLPFLNILPNLSHASTRSLPSDISYIIDSYSREHPIAELTGEYLKELRGHDVAALIIQKDGDYAIIADGFNRKSINDKLDFVVIKQGGQIEKLQGESECQRFEDLYFKHRHNLVDICQENFQQLAYGPELRGFDISAGMQGIYTLLISEDGTTYKANALKSGTPVHLEVTENNIPRLDVQQYYLPSDEKLKDDLVTTVFNGVVQTEMSRCIGVANQKAQNANVSWNNYGIHVSFTDKDNVEYVIGGGHLNTTSYLKITKPNGSKLDLDSFELPEKMDKSLYNGLVLNMFKSIINNEVSRYKQLIRDGNVTVSESDNSIFVTVPDKANGCEYQATCIYYNGEDVPTTSFFGKKQNGKSVINFENFDIQKNIPKQQLIGDLVHFAVQHNR